MLSHTSDRQVQVEKYLNISRLMIILNWIINNNYCHVLSALSIYDKISLSQSFWEWNHELCTSGGKKSSIRIITESHQHIENVTASNADGEARLWGQTQNLLSKAWIERFWSRTSQVKVSLIKLIFWMQINFLVVSS